MLISLRVEGEQAPHPTVAPYVFKDWNAKEDSTWAF